MGKREGGGGGDDRPRKKHMANSFGRANVRKRFAAKHARVFDRGSICGILASTDPNKEPNCITELTTLLKDTVNELISSGGLSPTAPVPAAAEAVAGPSGESGTQAGPSEVPAASEAAPKPAPAPAAEVVDGAAAQEGERDGEGESESPLSESEDEGGGPSGAQAGPSAPRLWRVIDTGTAGLVFVAAAQPWLDVRAIVDRLVQRAQDGTLPRPARFTYRVLPVVATCAAEMGAVERLCQSALPAVFGPEALPAPVSYGVQFKGRNNERVKREEAIRAAAAGVGGRHAVDLRDPAVTVFLDVFVRPPLSPPGPTGPQKAACAVSVVAAFNGKCKCNLAEIARRRAAAEKG